MNFKTITFAAVVGAATLTAAPAQAFGFGNLIKSVGGAAGVAPITDVVGGAIHQTEVENTNRMLQDNARKAQLKQGEIEAQNRATEEAIQAEVARRMAAERAAIAEERARITPPKTKSTTQSGRDGEFIHPNEILRATGEMIREEGGSDLMDLIYASGKHEIEQECAYAGNPKQCIAIKMKNANILFGK